MPMLPKRPCPVAGCPVLGFCAQHQRPRVEQPRPRLYDDRRGSSTARGYSYKWQQMRKQYIALHPVCVKCGRPSAAVDHIIPRRAGGADDERNYQALCHACHSKKTAVERRQRIC